MSQFVLLTLNNMEHEQSIQSLDDLHRLCENQVARDNIQFGLEPASLYLPNPIFTLTPKYCLIAMEPSLVEKALVDQGYKNFVGCGGNGILQYCAYTFLCHESFDYQITDISKGTMKTDIADNWRNIRYTNWLSILKQELEFFGNPSLVAIGSKAKNFLTKKDFELCCSLMHYSQRNNKQFRDYYEQHTKKYLADGIHIRLKEFVTKMMEKLNYTSEMKAFVLTGQLNDELPIWKRGMFLYYMDEFSKIATHIKTLHNSESEGDNTVEEYGQTLQQFWTSFKEYMESVGSFISLPKPQPKKWAHHITLRVVLAYIRMLYFKVGFQET